jgi:F0F1-type ATP synthase assembly protein I
MKAQDYLRFTSLGIQFAVTFGLPVLGGYWIDQWLSTGPWILLVGTALGAVAAYYLLVKAVFPRGTRGRDDGTLDSS